MKAILIALAALLGAAVPLSIAYLIWSWATGLVPSSAEHAWVAKLVVSGFLIWFGGAITAIVTLVCAVAAGMFASIALEQRARR